VVAAGLDGVTPIVALAEKAQGEKVKIVAMITGVRRVPTKTNRTMAIVELEDLTGSVELVAFPDVYERYSELWNPDQIVEVTAKVDRRGEQLQLICESATSEIAVACRMAKPRRAVHLRLPEAPTLEHERRIMQNLYELLVHYEGDDEVVLHVPTSRGVVKLRSRSRRVDWNPELEAALREVLGPQHYEVREDYGERLAS